MSIVSGTIGAVMGSDAQTSSAESAANATRDASAESVAEQRRQYDQTREDFKPYQDLGTAAAKRLADRSNYSPSTGYTSADFRPRGGSAAQQVIDSNKMDLSLFGQGGTTSASSGGLSSNLAPGEDRFQYLDDARFVGVDPKLVDEYKAYAAQLDYPQQLAWAKSKAAAYDKTATEGTKDSNPYSELVKKLSTPIEYDKGEAPAGNYGQSTYSGWYDKQTGKLYAPDYTANTDWGSENAGNNTLQFNVSKELPKSITDMMVQTGGLSRAPVSNDEAALAALKKQFGM